MTEVPAGAVSENGAVYRRHRPEDTLLYQIVAQHYRPFAAMMHAQGRPLPGFVQREFEDYLKCGCPEYGFLRVRCAICHAEKLVAFSCKHRGFCPSCGLGIVIRAIEARLVARAGYTRARAQTGAVTATPRPDARGTARAVGAYHPPRRPPPRAPRAAAA